VVLCGCIEIEEADYIRSVESLERLNAIIGQDEILSNLELPANFLEKVNAGRSENRRPPWRLELLEYQFLKLAQPKGQLFAWCKFALHHQEGTINSERDSIIFRVEVIGMEKNWRLFSMVLTTEGTEGDQSTVPIWIADEKDGSWTPRMESLIAKENNS
jgi:hypothetical protein